MQVSDFRNLSIGDEVIAPVFGKIPVTNIYTRVIGTQPIAHITLQGLGELSEHESDAIGLVN